MKRILCTMIALLMVLTACAAPVSKQFDFVFFEHQKCVYYHADIIIVAMVLPTLLMITREI